jgi:hypothetical protein
MNIEAAIAELQKERATVDQRLRELDAAIGALQKVCAHDFVYDGHDSHYSYERCKKCDKQQQV